MKEETSPQEENELILREALQTLVHDFRCLNKAINFNDVNARKLMALVNSRYKIAQSIFDCISLMTNPRYRIRSSGALDTQDDLARMVQEVADLDKQVLQTLKMNGVKKVVEAEETMAERNNEEEEGRM